MMLLSLSAPSEPVVIWLPLPMIPNVSAFPADWATPQRSLQLRIVLFVAPAPAPRLESQTAAVALWVLVVEIVRSRVVPPLLDPSIVT